VGDHERNGCVYQTIGQLTKERVEDRMVINDLKGRLADMETRMRRVESTGVSGGSSPFTRGWRSSAGGGFIPELDLNEAPCPREPPTYASGSNTWESPEDYMLAQFERMETKIEDLRKTVTELDGRHSVMLLNETMPLKDQIAELRSNIGVIGMHTTWLMNVQRQNRGQPRASGPGMTPSGGANNLSGAAGSRREADDGQSSIQPRRLSDGRGEHPPRL
jgi:hypothetical protein